MDIQLSKLTHWNCEPLYIYERTVFHQIVASFCNEIVAYQKYLARYR